MLSQEQSQQLLNAMVEKIKEMNSQEIATRTYCNKVFILKDGKGIGLPFEFKSPDEKELAFYVMNQLLKKFKPDMAFFTSEALFLQKKDNGEDFDLENMPLPSESPKRKEAYIITARTHGFARMVILPFERLEDGSIQFEKEVDYDSGTGNTTYDKLFDGVFTDDMKTIGGMQ